MTPVAGESALLDQVWAPENRELRLLAAGGLVPLPSDQLIRLQVALAASAEEDVAQRAQETLQTLERRILVPYLVHDAGADELAYFGRRHADPQVLEAVLRRRDVARELLVELAPRLGPDLQEILLLRQDAIVDEPEILESLAHNPKLSLFARRRIDEYWQHLLRRPAAPAVEALIDTLELTVEERVSLEQARKLPREGEVDEHTGLSEGQIRALPVPVRIKLSRGASRTLRGILIKDLNAQVAVSVLENCAFSDDEIEAIASNRSVIDDVLAAIIRRREWVSKYGVVLALIKNPKSPVGATVRLLPRLSVRDLKLMSMDRNVADAVRSTAQRLYKIKAR